MLIMRDVLEWPAADVADLLGTTTTAVNSGLRRARAQLAQARPAEDELAEPAEPDRRALLDQFAPAIENADANALAGLLRAEVAAAGVYQAHALLVPTVTPTGIARIIAFQDLTLFGCSACRSQARWRPESAGDLGDRAVASTRSLRIESMYSMPVIATRCSVGRIPNTPQNAAGHWIDPLVSPAMSNGVRPAATATAGPVDEPPAVRSAFQDSAWAGRRFPRPQAAESGAHPRRGVHVCHGEPDPVQRTS